MKRCNTAVPAYIERYGVNPTILLDEKHMSDEASKPEDDSGETKEEWKIRMGGYLNISSSTALAKIKFLEVIKPEWRSEEVCFSFLR